MNINYLFC